MKKKEFSLIAFKNSDEPVEVDANSRKVSGYFASFGTKDSDSDVIIPGAFSKSINERGPGSEAANKVAYLWQHDMKEPLGKLDVLTEDEKGLYFEASISDFELGDRVLEQYKDGTLNQHSIGFRYVRDKLEYEEETDTFIVKEVNLFEGSVVTLGANPHTPFVGLKGLSEEDQIKEIEGFIKSLRLDKTQLYTLRKHFEVYKHLEPSIKDTLSRTAKKDSKDSQQSEKRGLDYKFLLDNLKN